MDFGDYCLIEQKRYAGHDNEMFLYKVIRGNMTCNNWMRVPVDGRVKEYDRGDMSEVIQVICCGVDETKVETVRLCDVKSNDKFKENGSMNFNEDKMAT